MDYVWSMLEDGYYKHGIRSFWLDASEPEYYEIPQWVSATNSASCRRIQQCFHQWPHRSEDQSRLPRGQEAHFKACLTC